MFMMLGGRGVISATRWEGEVRGVRVRVREREDGGGYGADD
jgi:hypothetical protein